MTKRCRTTIFERLLLWLLLGCLSSACSLHSIPPRPSTLPVAKSPQVNVDRHSQTLELPNGLTLVHVPTEGKSIRLGLLFAGGSIDDPDDSSGLTVLLSNIGLTTSESANLMPAQEALALGSRLTPVADNTVFGWTMRGDLSSFGQMLAILHRVGTRRSFDSSELRRLTSVSSVQMTNLLDPGVQHALGVAVGAALGLKAPKSPYGRSEGIDGLTVDRVASHWERLVSPRRGAIVVFGGRRAAIVSKVTRVFGTWKKHYGDTAHSPGCWPTRARAHLVIDPTATTRRIYSIVALRVPSPGEPGRESVEIAVDAFGRVPGGRLARVLGEERARDVSPHIMDLGWNGGDKGSVLLMRLSGPSRETLRALWDVLETIQDLGIRPPKDSELDIARRHLAALRDEQRTTAFAGLLSVARRGIYGPNKFQEGDFEAHVQAIFRRQNVSIIGVGPEPLGKVLSELGTLTVWDVGGLILDGDNRPGCSVLQSTPP